MYRLALALTIAYLVAVSAYDARTPVFLQERPQVSERSGNDRSDPVLAGASLDSSLGPGPDGETLGDSYHVPDGGAIRDGCGLGCVASPRIGWTEAVATFYHPSLKWDGKCCLMADGLTEYHPTQSGYIAATDWPLFTTLYVCGESGRCLYLEVRDTGLGGHNWIDTSEADSMALSGRDWPSTSWVRIWREN